MEQGNETEGDEKKPRLKGGVKNSLQRADFKESARVASFLEGPRADEKNLT